MAYEPHETISQRIKRAGLPESYRIHWSDERKADVVRAVQDNLISFDEARGRYLLSRAEFEEWQQAQRAAPRDVPFSAISQREAEDA